MIQEVWIMDVTRLRTLYREHLAGPYSQTDGELFFAFDEDYNIALLKQSNTDLGSPSVARPDPRNAPRVAFAGHTHPFRDHPVDGPSSQDHLVFAVFQCFVPERRAHVVFDRYYMFVITPDGSTAESSPVRAAIRAIADRHADDPVARDAAALAYVNRAHVEFMALVRAFPDSLLAVDHLKMRAPVMSNLADAFRYAAANAKIAGNRVRVYKIDQDGGGALFDSNHVNR